jgi:nucleotide-binding universal stress UspA family protein
MSRVSDILAVVEDEATRAEIRTVAQAMAEIVHASVTPLRASDEDMAKRSAAILAEVADPEVRLAVLAANAVGAGACWPVVSAARKPVVLVPRNLQTRTGVISRVLLPLDGTPEAAAAVSEATALFADAGVDLLVLHVFDESTVPRFWDQPAHALPAWSAEFLARHVPHVEARLTVRSGEPGDQVIGVAEEEKADLIALGWSRNPDPGRARTVHQSVRDARVPVLLLPTDQV